MKGPFDDILQWPFRHDVKFLLYYQKSDILRHTHTMEYSDNPDIKDIFDKPINERNCGYGHHRFIGLEELSKQNKIFIKCAVKPVQ